MLDVMELVIKVLRKYLNIIIFIYLECVSVFCFIYSKKKVLIYIVFIAYTL
jgi:hypothetical protein